MKSIRVIGITMCLFLWASQGIAKETILGNVPIKIGGFLSTYGNITDKETPYLRFAKATDRADFSRETILGLQVEAQLGEKIDIVTQIVGDRYLDDFSVNVDWAFVKFNINDYVDLRMGKLGLPAFLYSDYLNVRYAYTWARVPSEAYEMMPLSAFTGIDLLVRIPVGDYTLNLQPYYGNASLTSPFGFAGEVTTTLNEMLGLVVAFELDSQTFRVSYFEGEVSMEDPAFIVNLDSYLGAIVPGSDITSVPISGIINNMSLSFYSVSYMLNLGGFEFITEWSERNTPNNLISSFQANFVSFAYQLGDYKPYVVFALLDTRNQASRPQEQDSITVGVRIEMSGSIAMKIEFQNANIDTDNPANQGLFALSSGLGGEELDGVNLLSVGFDAVF